MTDEIDEVLIPLSAVLTDEIKDRFCNILADMTVDLKRNYGVPDQVAYAVVAKIMVGFFQHVAEAEEEEHGLTVITEKKRLQ